MPTIPLTKNKVAYVDRCDIKLAKAFGPWQFHVSSTGRTGYAVTWVQLLNWRKAKLKRRQFRVFLHDLIACPPTGKEADHKDGDGLNNRRKNLRLATRQQQCFNRALQKNTSGYKGVSCKTYPTCGVRWHAHIRAEGRQIHIGTFKTKEAAAIAYNRYAKKYFGEFARLNKVSR